LEEPLGQHRRAILKALAIAIIVYAIVVVVYASLVPYTGIRFYLNRVERVEAQPVAVSDPPGPGPRPGDILLEIANQPVRADRAPFATIVHTIANLNDERLLPSVVVQTPQELASANFPVARFNDQRLVRLRFQAPADDPDRRGTFDAWMVVDELPVSKSVTSIAWLAIESVVFWLGWLVFRRRPEDDSAALFFLMCIVTVGAYMGWYHWIEIASSPPLIFVFASCSLALAPISLHFHLVTPSPKRLIQRYPKLSLTLLYLIPALLQIAILWAVSRLFHAFRYRLPKETATWEAALQVLVWIYIAIGAAMFLTSLVSLGHSFLAPRQPGDRDQVRWLLGGSLVAGLFIAYTLWVAATDRSAFLAGDATWAMFLASLAFAAAYAVSILRYRLLRIEEIVEQRGWIYLLIRFVGGVTFYGIVLAVIGLTPRLFAGVPQNVGLLITSSVVLILYILTTLRSWIGALFDRRFYRERSQLMWAMRRMNEAVGNLVNPATVQQHVMVIAAGCVSAQAAALYVRSPRHGFLRGAVSDDRWFPERLEADHPIIERLQVGGLLQKAPRALIREDADSFLLRSVGADLAQPLIHDGKLIGLLLLGPRREGMYNSAELSFLTGVADLATIALHGAQSQQTLDKLNRDLRHRVERVSAPLTMPERGSITAIKDAPIPVRPPLIHVESLRGSGTAIGTILETVRKVADSSATVLIRGESGTGKSMLAEIIHRNSPRSSGPFVKVHCAALSPSLLESELFGHVRGAFTGAHRDKIGRFQLADGGTLFLDEIGDISVDTQTKLLRVLQEMTFEPVGTSESIRVDVRIVAATHQPLEELIKRGRLREDLYYRLNVISIRMPSLRERREDIAELTQHFLATYADQTKKTLTAIDDDAMEVLTLHDWPGNIRELQNVIEHAVVMAGGPTITRADLPVDLALHGAWRDVEPALVGEPTTPRSTSAPRASSLSVELDSLERQRLLATLERVAGNKSQAARALGIPRSTLCSKLIKYGIE
jgi:transcriptional regulator with GAF, ATPase, and Fis domain